MTVGTAGNHMTISAPAIQYHKVSEGDRNLLQVHNLDFKCIMNGATPEPPAPRSTGRTVEARMRAMYASELNGLRQKTDNPQNGK